MLFLTLYTPAVKSSGPPSPEHLEKMMALIERTTKDGSLVHTGPLTKSGPGGARVRLKNGTATVDYGPFDNSTLMGASGFALIRAASREDAVRQVREFLEVAGDGDSELLQVLEGPPPDTRGK